MGTGKHDGDGVEEELEEEKYSQLPATKTAKAAITAISKHANTTKIHANALEFTKFLALPVLLSLPFSERRLILGRSRSQL